jgi:tetratricopeptide (TPR) repeat protein
VDSPNREARDAVTPGKVILDIAKRFDDPSGAGFIGHELLRVGPPSSPAGAAQSGRILMEAGLLDEAEALYSAMERSFSRHPSGFIGLAQVAMRRKSWSEALTRWDGIFAAFGGVRNAFWLSGRALVLFELGRRQESTAIHADLLREFPDEPAAYAGLAQIALRERRWLDALSHLDGILARFSDHGAADGWRATRATVLLEVGQAAEAEAAAKAVVEKAPGLESALLALLRVYIHTGRPEAAWQLLNRSPFRTIQTIALSERRLDVLIRLQRHDAARAIFEQRLRDAQRAEVLASLFSFVPALYHGLDRRRIWNILLQRLGDVRKGSSLCDRASLHILQARLQLALRDPNGVVATMRDLTECEHLGENGEALHRVSAVLNDPRFPDFAKPKVFGIGLSRTGTTSLAAALASLGFHTLHWLNPLTYEVISDDDFPIFDAFTDTPISANFEDLYQRFPNSKFIFTTRNLEDWVRSMSGLFSGQFGMSDFDQIKAELSESMHGSEYTSINRKLYFDHESYRDAFEAYEQRVRRFFRDKPAGRFLELNIFAGDGWPELCAFVGREAPSIPFPWENRMPARS